MVLFDGSVDGWQFFPCEDDTKVSAVVCSQNVEDVAYLLRLPDRYTKPCRMRLDNSVGVLIDWRHPEM